MIFKELSESDKDQYNHFVASQPSGSFLQSWEWGEWQINLGRTVYRFIITDESGEQVGSIQLIKMPLPAGKHYLYAPYAPIVEKNFQFSIFNFQTGLQHKFPDAVFYRIEPKFNISGTDQPAFLKKTQNIQPGKTLVMDLNKSEEQLLTEMHHKTRYNIKVAQKHGVEIQCEFNIAVGHGLFYDEALQLLVETAKRQKYQTYPLSYYAKLLDFFMMKKSDVGIHLYKAIFQNQLLATAVMVDFGQIRTFLFGGSSEFHKNVMAPYLLHWNAMIDAQKQKMTQYDFWGIETAKGDTPGFVRFKLGFSGQQLEYLGAYDLINQIAYYKIYQMARAINGLRR